MWALPAVAGGFIFMVAIATAPRKVMSGMERQIAELSGREESTKSLARESKQKARETGSSVVPTYCKLSTMRTSFLCAGSPSPHFLFYFLVFFRAPTIVL